MAEPPVDQAERKRRKAHLLANEIGLTRTDRHELAEQILLRDITSWTTLEEDDYVRLLDAMSGFQLICRLLVD